MDIRLLCHKCHEVLEDKFSQPTCYISIGYTTRIELECLKCGNEVFVKLTTEKEAPTDG